MASAAFGRYSPNNTFFHKLDPRNKLFLTIALIVVVFFQFSVWSSTILLTICYLTLLIILMICSKVSFFDLFKSLSGMWIMVLFLFAIYLFIPNKAYEGGPICFYIYQYPIYWEAIYQAGYIIFRMVLLVSLMMVFTSTTKPMEITYAFEWYMTPLKIIHFPTHELAMTLSIAIRFIPTILEETERIMKAQASRGVDFNHGGLFKRFRSITSLIVPLFISAIDRSEELANAMEARGYDPKAKRTKFRQLKFSWRDLISSILVIAFVAFIVTLFVCDSNLEGGLNIIEILFKTNIGF